MSKGSVTARLAIARAVRGVVVRGASGKGRALTIRAATEFLDALWPELLREARIASVMFAGGRFYLAKRKPQRARTPDGRWHEGPGVRRLVWKGPRL